MVDRNINYSHLGDIRGVVRTIWPLMWTGMFMNYPYVILESIMTMFLMAELLNLKYY